MNLLDVLENGLFAIGQVLRFPVMAALWLCVLVTVFQCGLAVSASLRRYIQSRGYEIKSWIAKGGVTEASSERLLVLPAELADFVRAARELSEGKQLGHGGLENLLSEHEARLRHSLDWARSLVKVGPSLGLLGTLIPMGASLAAMAGGDLNAMAAHMVVAFTTTIIGIAVGTVAYVVVAARQGMVNTSIREMRYLAEKIAVEGGVV